MNKFWSFLQAAFFVWLLLMFPLSFLAVAGIFVSLACLVAAGSVALDVTLTHKKELEDVFKTEE